jgi:Zn-finger protein
LFCDCKLFENRRDTIIEDVRNKIIQCVNVDTNDSKDLHQVVLEEMNKVIVKAWNKKESLTSQENINVDHEDKESNDAELMFEEKVMILELLHYIIDLEVKFGSFTISK